MDMRGFAKGGIIINRCSFRIRRTLGSVDYPADSMRNKVTHPSELCNIVSR